MLLSAFSISGAQSRYFISRSGMFMQLYNYIISLNIVSSQILNSGDPLTTDVVTEIIKFQRPNDDVDQIKLISAQMPASLACLGNLLSFSQLFWMLHRQWTVGTSMTKYYSWHETQYKTKYLTCFVYLCQPMRGQYSFVNISLRYYSNRWGGLCSLG